MADNILTLALAWTAIDLLEYLNTLRLVRAPAAAERAVIALTFRAAGTGVALWAAVVNAAAGGAVALQETSPDAWLFLLLAVGLRLGVIPLHLPFREDVTLRRGMGSALRLTAAATSLVMLARLPAGALEAPLLPALLVLVALAALYAGWKWLSLPDELNARPYWIIGTSALSLAAALRGGPQGSAAWGAALVLFGGLSFLYSARRRSGSRACWPAWRSSCSRCRSRSRQPAGRGTSPCQPCSGRSSWPPMPCSSPGACGICSAAEKPRLGNCRAGRNRPYPLGLGVLALTLLVTGVWGWPGGLHVGRWRVSLLLTVLALLTGAAFWRLRRFAPGAQIPLCGCRNRPFALRPGAGIPGRGAVAACTG